MSALLVPGVTHRLLPGKSTALLQPRWINVHTMVWALNPCEDYFRRAGNPYSHFGTGYDGEIRQWQDLRYRAASCYKANPYTISIENADKGTGFPSWTGTNVPRFTDAQADSLVVLLSWLCHRFGLPKEAIDSSCPHERGIGWHRLGVDPWRNTSCGLLMSSSRGKVCPGDVRIHQLVHEIIPAVSAPAHTAPSQEDDYMDFSHMLAAMLRHRRNRNDLTGAEWGVVAKHSDTIAKKAPAERYGAYVWIITNEPDFR